MDENEYNFDFEGNESWMLLVLLAMIGSMSNPETPDDILPCCTPYQIDDGQSFMQADKITLDEFTIEQMRAAAMNKKETEKLRLDSLYGDCVHKEKDEDSKDVDDYKRELEEIKKELKRYNDEYIKEHEPDEYRGLYGRSWDV